MSDDKYHTHKWRKKRKAQLSRNPLCGFCLQLGKTTPATVADHITPHNGDDILFWHGKLQSLCAKCHSSVKQRQENTGKLPGADAKGMPFDENHHWNIK